MANGREVVRTNWAPDPRGTGAKAWYVPFPLDPANPAEYVVADDGPPLPDGTICTTCVRSALGLGGSVTGPGPGSTPALDGEVRLRGGDRVGVNMWLRLPRQTLVRLTASFYAPTGSSGGSSTVTAPEEVEIAADTWTQLSGVVVAPANPDGWSTVSVNPRLQQMTKGDLVDVSVVLVDFSGATDWFDGGSLGTGDIEYGWTATPNASPSTATRVSQWISANLVASSQQPQPVQVVLSNLREGVAYQVTGIGTGGRTWPVAGGVGVSEGEQIILVDNRAPLNMPVRYRLVTTSGAQDSNTVTVDWAPPDGASGKYLVQSLDGNTVVPIARWIDNELPKTPVLHAAAFDVRDRRRPVMVLAAAGDGTTQVTWRLSRAASTQLERILADGGGIAIRTDGNARDLPAADLAVITQANNALWRGHHGVSTDRVWELELTWIDDPEPSTIPIVWDVSEVDDLLAGRTVDEVDAMFADQTVDEVDALDWGILATDAQAGS